MKNQFIKANLLLASVVCLTACGGKVEKNAEESSPAAEKSALVYTEKTTNYAADDTTEVLIDDVINKSDIVKVIKHGDHWHVFTKDGKEHITYTDPDQLSDNETLEMVSVVSLNQLRGMNVTSIKVHGNHWHVYTADGSEYLTYEDPSALFSNIRVEQYVGNHGIGRDYRNNTSHVSHPVRPAVDPSEVVKILKHEDHYHVYTADGTEFVTYSDPRSLYPNAEYGTYVGSHGTPHVSPVTNPVQPANPAVPSTPVLPKPTPNKPSNPTKPVKPIPNIPGLVSVVEPEQLVGLPVVKILKHEDHYHVYTKDNKEYITYKNPGYLFPKIKVGTYVGSHGNPGNNNTPTVWPEGVNRIVDHGDHWHLYVDNKEVGVVRENPKSHYPNAEYIDERPKNSDVVVKDDELFAYKDVESKVVDSVLPYLSSNLKAMTNYGVLNTDLEVYGVPYEEKSKEIFYWLHGSHYHAISIKQIIQGAKAGEFGKNSAKDVVSTLKYMIEHPNETIEAKVTVDRDDIVKYLMNYYKLNDKMDVEYLPSIITVYAGNGNTFYFLPALFTKVDGVVSYSEKMPTVGKKDDSTTKPSTPTPAQPEKPAQPVTPEKPATPTTPVEKPKPVNNMSFEDAVKKYAALYGMSEEEFEDAFFELEDSPQLNQVKFNNDGTVEYGGKKYDFKTAKALN